MVVASLAGVALTACSSKHAPSAAQIGSSPDGASSSAPPSVVPQTTSPAPSPSPANASATPTAAPAVTAEGAVPAGFAPQSVTFVSASDGFTLGAAPCSKGSCATLVATHDGGSSWHSVGQLPPSLVGDNPAISKVRFATLHDGWAFGPQLWSTHDGGNTWRQIIEPQAVSDVEAAGGVAYAIVGGQLERTAVAADSWQTVKQLDKSATMALHGHAVWIVEGVGAPGTTKLLTSADGAAWQLLPDPCASLGSDWALSSVAPVSTTHVYLLCGGGVGAGSESKKLMFSIDGGHTANATMADPPRGGIAGGVAAASDSVVTVTALSGASEVYRSGDAGKTWQSPLQQGDGGVGYFDVGFTTATQGVAIYGRASMPDAPTPELLMSHDAGATWSVVHF
jgi:hypothetical protein